MNVAAITDGLEPAAVDAKERCPGLPIAEVAALSLAASVKRIADRLDALDMTAVGNQLLDIAWQAGQNFRGKQ